MLNKLRNKANQNRNPVRVSLFFALFTFVGILMHIGWYREALISLAISSAWYLYTSARAEAERNNVLSDLMAFRIQALNAYTLEYTPPEFSSGAGMPNFTVTRAGYLNEGTYYVRKDNGQVLPTLSSVELATTIAVAKEVTSE